jgi:hypothetical protein
MPIPAGLRFRAAGPGDAHAIAALHAGSWQRAFYAAQGGACVERAETPPPGGDPARLNGKPVSLRYAWRDPSKLLPGRP